MEIFVLAMPVVLLLLLGLGVGVALTHWVAAWPALALVGGLFALSVVLIVVSRTQTGFDGIGTVILATLVAAPAALGLLLGAGLVLWRRGRGR